MRAPSWAASGRGWFGPLSRSRLPFRRWLSLLRGCLIWRLATDGLVMAPVMAQLAQARGVTGSAVHTSHTQHPQSNQPNPNPNPPISCKRRFFFTFPLFGSFCPSSSRVLPCPAKYCTFSPDPKSCVSPPAELHSLLRGSCHRLHMACTTGLDRPCFHFSWLLSFVVHMEFHGNYIT